MKLAIVAAGKTGAEVLGELEKHMDADSFCVGCYRDGADSYSYDELEVLADILEDYERVVFVAMMGSTAGDAVVYFYRRLKGVKKLAFLAVPSYADFDKFIRSRKQMGEIMGEEVDFEGAVLSVEHLVGEEDVEGTFGRSMAEIVLEMIR